MSKRKFIPTSKETRLQPYLKAFNDDVGFSLYLNYITKYLQDSNISLSNKEDVAFFRSLICDSQYANLNLTYFRFITQKINIINYDWCINIIIKYIDFIGQIYPNFQIDLFEYLIKDIGEISLIEKIIKELSQPSRVSFLEVAAQYPFILKSIPKIKLYLLFS